MASSFFNFQEQTISILLATMIGLVENDSYLQFFPISNYFLNFSNVMDDFRVQLKLLPEACFVLFICFVFWLMFFFSFLGIKSCRVDTSF
jgi:hypothetical protein